jgi:hypothetical protein
MRKRIPNNRAQPIALEMLQSIDCGDDKANEYLNMAIVRLKLVIWRSSPRRFKDQF